MKYTTSGRDGTGRRASFRGWRAQARAGSNPAAPTTVDLSHPHGWFCSYKDVRIYEVSLTAQLSGTIVHVQNGPVAQRWSRGLIILWFSVRIRVGPPQKCEAPPRNLDGAFFSCSVSLALRRCRPCPSPREPRQAFRSRFRSRGGCRLPECRRYTPGPA